MKKRLLSLNIAFAAVMLITYLLLNKEGHLASNVVVLVFVMATFVLLQHIYLSRRWFRHIEELPELMKKIKQEESVKVYELSKEPLITELQYGLEGVSEHIETISRKYSHRKGQLEAILESLKIGIVAVRQDGSIIFHNPKFNEIYKVGLNLQGKDIYENIYDSNLIDVLEHSLTEDIYILPNVVQPNGLVFNYKGLEMKSVNERIGTLLVIEDVTKVYHIDKMKSDFVSNVTHELKTPLTSIRGFTETLQQVESTDIETRNRFLSIIESESERLSLLINDILYLSEVESTNVNEKVDVDLNSVCAEVVELTKQSVNDLVELLFEADKHYVVKFEPRKFKQMLLNLVSNAAKYTDEGFIKVELSSDSDFVVLKVMDTGIGIPEKDQGSIFGRFYRVDKGRSRKTGGTGLGLSIVKHIVERNEAQIILESEEGQGTTITVYIKK